MIPKPSSCSQATSAPSSSSLYRSHLMHACSSGEEHLLQTRQALQHYKSFGESFARLAREYQELLVETENKQWALSELGKSDAS